MDYRAQIEPAISATLFHSKSRYSWFGKISPELPARLRAILDAETLRTYLVQHLGSTLYQNFYCHGLAMPSTSEAERQPQQPTPFLRSLSDANVGRCSRECDWVVGQITGSQVQMRKAGITLHVGVDADTLRTLSRGDRIEISFANERINWSPGYYTAVSERALGDRRLVRLYWNIASEGAAELMCLITSTLVRSGIPYQFKTLSDPDCYSRCDAAVLYLREGDCRGAMDAVLDIRSRLAHCLKPMVPALTRRLAPGLGFAQDPGNGMSFGVHRCRLLAEAMLRAHERRATTIDARLAIVEQHLAQAHVSLEEPYLGGRRPRMSAGRHAESKSDGAAFDGAGSAVSREDYLNVALNIGRTLAAQALWHDRRCTWFGFVNRGADTAETAGYRSLGPELYDGTSGVALFLAELYAATNEGDFRRTASGAMRQALAKANTVPGDDRAGLHVGWPGIALASARIGVLLGEEYFLREARLLAGRFVRQRRQQGFDLVSGGAGAIAALVILEKQLRDKRLGSIATRLADGLLRRADVRDSTRSWRSSEAMPARRNLTGLSHGASGVAYALLELYRATSDAKYRAAAEAAFRYETACFDSAAANWPDFRSDPDESRSRRSAPRFSVTWCHGAPGIALTRIRAFELLRNERWRTEALVALETTAASTRAARSSYTWNYSLCHGFAGNAEILNEAHRLGSKDARSHERLAHDIACDGIERYHRSGRQWPCGTGAGATAGLMIGTAGIGYFYLRLYNRKVPSILLPRAEEFAYLRA